MPEFPVETLLTKTCCNRKMTTCFKLLSQADIEKARERFYCNKTEVQQTQHILDYMKQHSRGNKSILYSISGHEVCEVCFRLVHGVRHNRFAAIKCRFLNGVVMAEHGRYGKSCLTDSTIRVISWLRTFIQKIGDRMPTKDEIHLPSCLTRADVYALAVDDLSQGGLHCCKLSTFYDVWKSHFPNVKIPKV